MKYIFHCTTPNCGNLWMSMKDDDVSTRQCGDCGKRIEGKKT